ncbi:MAG: L,D-transpeptidase family protein [Candidatus Omnitrophica bacterium]|nr:L,D-transpeptidase family protein [Candidatus Omnitrophota bacterium]
MKRFLIISAGILVSVFIMTSVFLLLGRARHNTGNQRTRFSEEALLKETAALEAEGKLLKAKELYQQLIRDYPQSKNVFEAEKAMWALNIKLLFSPQATPDSRVYEVQAQDTLGKIAKNFGTTVELIIKANNLKSDLIRPGMKLKISTAKFSALVDKSQNTLTLKSNDEIFKIYQVATGLDNSTPVGAFKVTIKIIDPTWYKAGAVVPPGSPKNILGTRWLGLSAPGYGIHGTTEPESIGKQATAGCVRMLNKDAEELYAIVPTGTEVTIAD